MINSTAEQGFWRLRINRAAGISEVVASGLKKARSPIHIVVGSRNELLCEDHGLLAGKHDGRIFQPARLQLE